METYKIIDNNNNVICNKKIENILMYIRENNECKLYKENGEEFNKLISTKTQFICHRVNEPTVLESIPKIFGTEIDVRENQNGGLMLSHDPWNMGSNFEDYITKYCHSTLILNIKSERIEYECMKILEKYNIHDFFFLDSSFPMMVDMKKNGETRFALRYSEYEPIPNITSDWIWVDCFSRFPLDKETYREIKSLGKKICIVSPELQKRPEDIASFRKYLIENEIIPDAICCKIYHIYDWL